MDNTLQSEIKKSLTELLLNGDLEEVKQLNKGIEGEKYTLKTNYLPMYFTGNLYSRIVFIDFNPGPGTLLQTKSNGEFLELDGFESNQNPIISCEEEYIEFFSNFGMYKMEHQRKRGEKPKIFDRKQYHFFKALGALDLETISNLEDAIIHIRNEKLQLEWVPYCSTSFSSDNFSDEYLNKRLHFIKTIIETVPRDLIFIVGKHELLEQHFGKANWVKRTPDGKKMSFTVGRSVYKNIPVLFIQSYKRQGLAGKLMEEYGAFCREVNSK